jgi:hypothetical protein
MEASGKTTALETMDMEVNRRDPNIFQENGTAGDDDEMTRMGKVQEFKVTMRIPLSSILEDFIADQVHFGSIRETCDHWQH